MDYCFTLHIIAHFGPRSPADVWATPYFGRLWSKICTLFMAALRSRCGHHIFALWFLSYIYLLSFFIPRLISAAADWMSTIRRHMVWP